EGKAIATDLETMVIADLPEAEEPMLLPFASLAEMLKYVPGNETIKIEVQNKKVSLAWSGGTASYPTQAIQDFPLLPEMPTKAEGTIDGYTLIAAMLAALPYVAADETRPVLCGVTLMLGSPIEVAAGDGFRMSHQVLGLSFPLEAKIIVPAHAVRILGHVFAKAPRTPPSSADSLIPIITAKALKSNPSSQPLGQVISPAPGHHYDRVDESTNQVVYPAIDFPIRHLAPPHVELLHRHR
ncbi:unnamed protein product, partial [marine sediment metagenome]